MADALILTLLLSMMSGPMHGHRLILMAAAGLAGMYMVHLLADDYNTYQCYSNQNQKPKFIRKRSVIEDVFGLKRDVSSISSAKEAVDFIKNQKHDISNHLLKMDLVLRFDPTGCARRYVCTIAVKPTKMMNKSEKNIYNMIRDLSRAGRKGIGQSAFMEALKLGRSKKDPEACSAEYSKCVFSMSQMKKLVQFF